MKMQVGVLGVGYWGRKIVEEWSAIPNVKVRAVSDLVDRNLEQAKDRYGVEGLFHDYREVLAISEIKAVNVCLPNALHFAACKDTQSAYERDGHGDFTCATTRALADALRTPTTYGGLAQTIAKSFAGNALQMPQLRARPESAALRLFAATRQAPLSTDSAGLGGSNAVRGPRIDTLIAEVHALSKKIDDV